MAKAPSTGPLPGSPPSNQVQQRVDTAQLLDQLESCEETQSLRRADFSRKIEMQLGCMKPRRQSAVGRHTLVQATAEVKDSNDCFCEGFTVKAAMELTERVRQNNGSVVPNLAASPLMSADALLMMLDAVEELLMKKRGGHALVEMPQLPGERFIVVGDTHGQLQDVLWMFNKFGLPSEAGGTSMLFNGDVADRGMMAVEIFILVFAWMLALPNAVFMNRGNHEDLKINLSPCGGFYNEVCEKYGDSGRIVFDAFGRVFASLPLAHLLGPLGSRVLVVHAGIHRHPTQMLPALRHAGARQASIDMDLCTPDNAVLIDSLWSDPQDEPGLSPSPRGPQIFKFGPDVTHRLCQSEGVGLVIRSHEVPRTRDGFEFRHDNRVCTVFSASNYGGAQQNQGGVLILGCQELTAGKLQQAVKLHRFYAPSLQEVCSQELEPPLELKEPAQPSPNHKDAWKMVRGAAHFLRAAKADTVAKVELAARRKSMASIAGTEQRAVLSDSVVQKVAELVVEHKAALWHVFWERDLGLSQKAPGQEAKRTGFVTLQVWQDACGSLMGQEVAWDAVGSLMKVAESYQPYTGLVDYNRFLHRFHVGLKVGSVVRSGWADEILQGIFQKLLDRDRTAQELLTIFDRNADGVLTIPELAEAFKLLDVGITAAQVRALFLTFAAHTNTRTEGGLVNTDAIDVSSFISAFVAIAQHQDANHVVRMRAWPKWALDYLRHLGKQLWTHTQGSEVAAAFEACDGNKNGLLEPDEFVQVMRHLEAQCAKVGPIGQPQVRLPLHQLRELADLADFSGEGQVSYLEVLTALQPADTALGGQVRVDLFEQICQTIWLHREALMTALFILDSGRTMRAGPAVITRALEELNRAVGGNVEEEQPLLPFQIEALVSHIQLDEDGQVNYGDFLDAFTIESACESGVFVRTLAI